MFETFMEDIFFIVNILVCKKTGEQVKNLTEKVVRILKIAIN